MDTPVLPSLLSFSLSLTLLLLLLLVTSSFPPSLSTPTLSTDPLDFVRSSCNTTLYPDLCYTTLSRYAHASRHDPARLVRFAIGTALIRAHRAASLISNMTHRADYRPDSRASSALHDCSSTFSDAVGQMRGSLKEITKLANSEGPTTTEAVRFQVSNVKTWMSSALTNEDTCSDGLADLEYSPLKKEVCNKVVMVKEYTSNALALVNNFGASLNNSR